MCLNRRGGRRLQQRQVGEGRQGWSSRRAGGGAWGRRRGRRSRRRGRPCPRPAPGSLSRWGPERSCSHRCQDQNGTWPSHTFISTGQPWIGVSSLSECVDQKRLCWLAQLCRPYQHPCCQCHQTNSLSLHWQATHPYLYPCCPIKLTPYLSIDKPPLPAPLMFHSLRMPTIKIVTKSWLQKSVNFYEIHG